MMEKLTFSDAQPELSKIASRMTLLDSSTSIKSATEDTEIRRTLADLKPTSKNHFLCHLIALGDGEHYSYNKNGDYFPKEACIKFHDTFVKNGHFFREHKNQDPKFKIGMVKASFYNHNMGRIELVIEGDKELCPDIYDSVKNGQSRSYSMSCMVPYDISSITMKKQATLKDYDEYCKHKMGQYIPEFKKYAYVINDKPKWFDISDVANPADRIAHFLEYKLEIDGQLAKAASAGGFISSAMLASIYPLRKLAGSPLGCESKTAQAILVKLASAEEYINLLKSNEANVCKDEKYHFIKNAASKAWNNNQLNDDQISALRKLVPSTMMTKLAKRAMFLPFESFCAVINGTKIEDTLNDPVIKYAVCCELPDVFKKIMNTPINQMEELFNSASDFEMYSDPNDGDVVNKLMDEAEKNFSVKPGPVKSRTITITISSSGKKPEMNEKKASFNGLTNAQKMEASNYAQAYGYYKIASIKKINELFGDNFIDLPESFLIIKQHNL